MAELATPEHLKVKNAERAVLGSIFLDAQVFDLINEILSPEDFHAPKHQLIFQSMRILSGRSLGINLISVIEALQQEGVMEDVGGESYIFGEFGVS